MIDDFPAVSNVNRLFLKLNRFICIYLPVLPDHRMVDIYITLRRATEWMGDTCGVVNTAAA